MSRERDDFIAEATRAGLPLDVTRALLRYATTLQRLAEAQCNGDYPADNGDRKVIPCPQCESGFVPHSFRRVPSLTAGLRSHYKICPDCYAQHRVTELLRGSGYQPVFNGDPRGAVLRLFPSGVLRDQIESGRVRGIYVPPTVRY